jgi:spore coat protein YutH
VLLQSLLKTYYGINADKYMPLGQYQSCKKGNQRFLLAQVNHLTDDELLELEQLTNHLKTKGDRYVCTFLPTKDEQKLLKRESGQYCVLSSQEVQVRTVTRIGRKLAKFHHRGRSISFPVKKISRIGKWKELWETRIDQMEKVWNTMLYQQPESDFDIRFIESFPYYMSIGENAIQYLVDTEVDDEPKVMDHGTVCHVRFSNETWGDDHKLRNPLDWVFDHCSRDLAEWTRERYHQHSRTYQGDVKQFYRDYQTIQPLSSFAWRLLYSRLLFPLHYVECIEEYYSTTSEQQKHILSERLDKYLQQSSEYERFLGQFYQLLEVPVNKFKIPLIDWL